MKTLKRSVCIGLTALLLTGCGNIPAGPAEGSGETSASDPVTAVSDINISSDAISVVISPENMSVINDGVFQGWGTSLCWWANRLGYSDELAQQSADLFFGENGLRFNIMRYNIGGGDDPTHDHITRTDSEVPGWLIYDEVSGEYVYDYDADWNQLNVLRRAVEAAGEDAYVEVFSNSPPYFMTESGCSSGHEEAGKNNLKPEFYTDFAEYLAHVTEYINNDLGIKVSSVSPMNEPNTTYWSAFSPKQEGCHVDPGEAQSSIIVETAKAFEANGLGNVEIIGSDETEPQKQIIAYNSYSEEAKSVIDRISTHTYGINGLTQLGALAKSEGFNLWMSEVDGGDVIGRKNGEMGSALWIARKIIDDINGLSPSAWVMWQVVDNHISADGYNGNKDTGMVNVNGGFWGAAVADHDNQNIILTQKYYAIGQFTRYIRPGATIIHCGNNALAAYHPDSHELTIVAVNTEKDDQEFCFELNGFTCSASSAQPYRTSGKISDGESWAQLESIPLTADGKLVVTLKEASVTTFVIGNVTLAN